MPTAQELEAKHALYGRYLPEWDWANAIRNGDLSLPANRKRWLVKGNTEEEDDFSKRVELTEYDPELPRIVGRICSVVWKRTPRRDIPKGSPLAEFADKAGIDGRDIGEIAKSAAQDALWKRYAVALLDHPAPDPTAPPPLTQADDKAAGLTQPYVVLYQPEQVWDWRFDHAGQLVYVKLASTPYPAGTETVQEVREVTLEGIVTWLVKWPTLGGEKRVESGPVAVLTGGFKAAKRLPVAVCQYDALDGMTSRTPLTECLMAEKRAFRLLSDFVWDVYLAGHPHLKVWKFPSMAPGRDGQLKPQADVGPGTFHLLHPGTPDKAKEDMAWLEINGPGLQLAWEAYQEARKRVYEKAGISGRAVASAQPQGAAQSGAQVQAEFEVDEGNSLAAVASMAEDFEWELLLLAALDSGATDKAADLIGDVAYHKEDFGLQGPERALARAQTIRGLYGFDSLLFKEALKRAARVAVPNLSEAVIAEIDGEIDAGKGLEPPAPPDLFGGAPTRKPNDRAVPGGPAKAGKPKE